MRRLRRFFNKILVRIGLCRPVRPEDIPDVLDKETLCSVLQEARLLHQQYQVEVHDLAPDEQPGPPRPAGEFDWPVT